MRRLWPIVVAAFTPSATTAAQHDGASEGPSRAPLPDSTGASLPTLARERNERPARWKGWDGPVRMWILSVVRHQLVLLFVGGGLGTIARYLLSKWFNEQLWGQSFPWGTFFINVSGSFILGAAAVLILERLPPAYQNWYLLLGTGFCGGYTTFSTFEWETYKLVRDGSWWYATANACGSLFAGFVGILMAVALVGAIFPKR